MDKFQKFIDPISQWQCFALKRAHNTHRHQHFAAQQKQKVYLCSRSVWKKNEVKDYAITH